MAAAMHRFLFSSYGHIEHTKWPQTGTFLTTPCGVAKLPVAEKHYTCNSTVSKDYLFI